MARRQQITLAIVHGLIWLCGGVMLYGILELVVLKAFLIRSFQETGEAWGMSWNTWTIIGYVCFFAVVAGATSVGVWWGNKRGKKEEKVTLFH